MVLCVMNVLIKKLKLNNMKDLINYYQESLLMFFSAFFVVMAIHPEVVYYTYNSHFIIMLLSLYGMALCEMYLNVKETGYILK